MAIRTRATKSRTKTPSPIVGLPAEKGSRRRRMAAGRVIVVGVVCFLVWALLDARSLQRSAQSSPFGVRRTVALAVLAPLVRVSQFLGLDRPGSVTDRVLGRGQSPGGGPLPLRALPPAEILPSLSPTSAPPGSRPPGVSGETPGRSTPALLPAVRTPTRAAPLRLLVVGDSIAFDFGDGLARVLGSTKLYKVTVDSRISTGLARDDYFNWPAQLRADLVRTRAEVVVVILGGNDNQGFYFRGKPVQFPTRAWQQAYGARVAAFMEEAMSGGRTLLWVGMPNAADPGLSSSMQVLNRIYRAEAAKQPGVVYVDSWHLFVNAAGRYSAYLPDGSGHQQLVRAPDGVHFMPAGGDRFARYVLTVLRTQLGLPS